MPLKIKRRWKMPLLVALTVLSLIDGILFVVAIKYQCHRLPCYLSSPIAWIVFHLPLLITWLTLFHTKPHITRCLLGAFTLYTLLGFLAYFASQPVICILETTLHWLPVFALASQRYLILFLVLPILTFYCSAHFRQLIVFGDVLSSTRAVHPQKLGYKDARQFMLLNDRDPKKPIQLTVRHIPRQANTRQHPLTVLFLVGAGGHGRGDFTEFYDIIVKHFNWNLVLFDYRGYNTSSPVMPTVSGLISDARAVYEWILSTGVPPSDILLWSHSLGTSVALNMLAELPQDKIPMAAILNAPFTRLVDVVRQHLVFRLLFKFDTYVQLPIFDWLTMICIYADTNLNFDSLTPLAKVYCPLLMIHAQDDQVVPLQQGWTLFLEACKRQPAQRFRNVVLHIVPASEDLGHMILVFDELSITVRVFIIYFVLGPIQAALL